MNCYCTYFSTVFKSYQDDRTELPGLPHMPVSQIATSEQVLEDN